MLLKKHKQMIQHQICERLCFSPLNTSNIAPLIFPLMMFSSLGGGGSPAVSFRTRVNKLRALCSRRHRSTWPFTLPTTNWPSAKGQTSPLLLLPSPTPSHPLFVLVSSPLPSSSLPFICLPQTMSLTLSQSSTHLFVFFHFVFSFSLSALRVPELSALHN